MLKFILTHPIDTITHIPHLIKWLILKGPEKYIYLEKTWYNKEAKKSKYNQKEKVDFVVGTYEKQNEYEDYDKYILKNIDDSFKEKVALDFACGPGRNIVKYQKYFKRIDGADISEINIKNAKDNLTFEGVKIPNLYVTNGNDLGDASNNTYNFILSTIAMQHIPVYDIRFSIFKHMYRVLKPGGMISIQMGAGKSPNSNDHSYYDNYYEAKGTNRHADTMVEDPEFLRKDLEKIGFKNFKFWLRPPMPGETAHKHWIFFQAIK